MIAKRLFPGVLISGALAAGLLMVTAASAQRYDPDAPAHPGAQSQTQAPPPEIQWDKKRLDRLERSVDRLENTIARIKPDKAPPNLIEPDPEVLALEARVDDLKTRLDDIDATLAKVNGALDAANLEIDRSHKAEAAAHDDAGALAARVTQLETKLAALEAAAQPAAPVQPAAGGDTGAMAAPTGDAEVEFKGAQQLYVDGQYAEASKAFGDFLAKWPDATQAPEAHYRLAETLYVKDDQPGSALEYAKSLKGWPHAKWAPDSIVKLAVALNNLGRGHDACAAVGEFDRRYAKEATASVKSRAQALKLKAKCGG